MMTMAAVTDGVAAPGTVSRRALPTDARDLSTLTRIDYEDGFAVDAPLGLTAEQWARAMVEDTPLGVRTRLVLGWTALGLRLGPPWRSDHILGWRVKRNDPDVVLLAAGSSLGLRGELLFRTEPRGLLFATFVQQGNPVARRVWARITVSHQAVVRSLLEHAARRELTAAADRRPTA